MCDFEGFRWRWSHTFHHSKTLQTEDDYDHEIQVSRPIELFAFFLNFIPLTDLLYPHKLIKFEVLKHAFGKFTPVINITAPKEVKKKVVEKPVQREDFIDLLDQKEDMSTEVTEEYLNDLSENLTIKLREFGIEGNVENNLPGPVITRFEISLAPGTKASQVSNIANDLARSLAVKSVRVVEVIEGKSTIGIEIPNPKRQIVSLYSIMKEFKQNELTSLEFCVGRDISRQASKINLQQLPHLLIAGTTGSGKSCLLYTSPSPRDVEESRMPSSA